MSEEKTISQEVTFTIISTLREQIEIKKNEDPEIEAAEAAARRFTTTSPCLR